MTNSEVFKKIFGMDIEEFMLKYSNATWYADTMEIKLSPDIREWADSGCHIILDEDKPRQERQPSRHEQLSDKYDDPFYIASTQSELAIMNVTLAKFLDLLEERWKDEDDNEKN